MVWTRRAPEPPPRGTGSDWYWYWPDGEKEFEVVDVYQGCWRLYTQSGYWWDEPISKPVDSLPKKRSEIKSILESMTEAETKAPRNYRGRGIL